MSLIRRNEVYWGFLRSLFSPLSSSTSLSDLSRVKRKVQKINHTVEKCGLRTNPSERFCFLFFAIFVRVSFCFGGRTQVVLLMFVCHFDMHVRRIKVHYFCLLCDVLEKGFVYGWHVSRFSEHLEKGYFCGLGPQYLPIIGSFCVVQTRFVFCFPTHGRFSRPQVLVSLRFVLYVVEQ